MKLLSSSSASSSSSAIPHWLPKLFFPSTVPNFALRRLRRPSMAAATSLSLSLRRNRRRDKVVVVMGATGSGKSQLSVDLATIFPAEIINSDKIQLYAGLDITTNKISPEDRLGIPHHLLGCVDPDAGELTASEYRSLAHSVVGDIVSRQKLPLIAGGSNSFIYALLTERFDGEGAAVAFSELGSVSNELRYDCCFIWVDVSFPVLDDYLRKRVDEMLETGMFEELVGYYHEPYNKGQTGLRKAIGVPEFDRSFRRHPPRRRDTWAGLERDPLRRAAYEEAVREIKENTSQLAKRQIGKIMRLREGGWNLRRLDATAALRAAMATGGPAGKGLEWAEIWETQVLGPTAKIVKRFLLDE